MVGPGRYSGLSCVVSELEGIEPSVLPACARHMIAHTLEVVSLSTTPTIKTPYSLTPVPRLQAGPVLESALW